MKDKEKLKRLDYLSSLPYSERTPEEFEEELRLECELEDHPDYKYYLEK